MRPLQRKPISTTHTPQIQSPLLVAGRTLPAHLLQSSPRLTSNMDVSNLISHDAPQEVRRQQVNHVGPSADQQRFHQYPTRHAVMTNGQHQPDQEISTPSTSHTPDGNQQAISAGFDHSPASPTPKNVAFELLFEGATNFRARLPMRVQIFPHDTTDSIVTTVKNFYGLYEGAAAGVSFEDDRGTTLIARYENLRNNMVVYVRVISDLSQTSQSQGQVAHHSHSPSSTHRVPHLDEALQMLPPQPAQALTYGQPLSRPSSRVSRKRSASPRQSRSQRSASVQKGRSRSGIKSRDASAHIHPDELNSDAVNGYSSSDGGAGSVASSRKSRSELASAEISLVNILEGGRRKRAKFESSVCPLKPSVTHTAHLLRRKFYLGIATVCSTSSTRPKFDFLHFPTTTIKRARQSIPFRQTCSATVRLRPATTIPTEPWSW